MIVSKKKKYKKNKNGKIKIPKALSNNKEKNIANLPISLNINTLLIDHIMTTLIK